MYAVKGIAPDNVVPKEIMYKLRGPNVDDGQSTSTAVQEGGRQQSLEEALKASLSLIDDLSKAIKTLAATESAKASRIAKSTKKAAAGGKAKPQAPKKVDVGPYFRGPAQKELSFNLVNNVSRANAQYEYTVINLPPREDKVTINVGEQFKPIILALLGGKPNPSGLTVNYSGNTLSIPDRHVQPAQVLEILGALLGLHDLGNFQFYGADRWLNEAVDVITGKKPVDSLVRSVNVHLGPNDLLTNVNNITLADIVVYHLVREVKHLPNNTELFVGRVQNALATA